MAAPSARRLRLARELHRLRKDAGLTRDEVAHHVGCSPVTIHRIETGVSGARVGDILLMLDLYEVTGEAKDLLVQLARDARARKLGWWQKVSEMIPNWFEVYVDLEDEASNLQEYQAEFVSGLLQTEDYARAIMRSAPEVPPEEEMERRVAIRMKRQERLTGDDPLKMWVIFNEAVLRREVGGPITMCQQLQRLIEASDLNNVTLQILPFRSGAHPAMYGSFVMLDFPKPSDPDVVYVEYWQGSLYLEDPSEVEGYTTLFHHLRANALGLDESRRLISQVMKEMS